MYDPFYPMGSGDMTEVLSMGLHLCHMMGYQELNDSWRIVTNNSAKTLHLDTAEYGIEAGKPANFNIFRAGNFFDVLRSDRKILYSVRHGKRIGGG